MRPKVLGLFVAGAVLLPTLGSAQAMQIRTALPEVTAANAAWQVSNDAIIVGSLVYVPTREYRIPCNYGRVITGPS